jgi:hypothetical protein
MSRAAAAWLAHHPTAAHKTHTSCCMSTVLYCNGTQKHELMVIHGNKTSRLSQVKEMSRAAAAAAVLLLLLAGSSPNRCTQDSHFMLHVNSYESIFPYTRINFSVHVKSFTIDGQYYFLLRHLTFHGHFIILLPCFLFDI